MLAKSYLFKILKVLLDKKGVGWPKGARIEIPKEEKFGDLATNIAMVVSSYFKRPPREIAESLKEELISQEEIEKIEVAGPGFLNFFFSKGFWQKVLKEVLDKKEEYGKSNIGKGKKVLVEYVSANPTGPLHVGHGRGAAVGDSIARILRFAGYQVDTEYYINDAGRQMKLLGLSIFIRYKQLFGKDDELCEECYKGDYIIDLAKELKNRYSDKLLNISEEEAISICTNFGKDAILEEIKRDLKEFRAEHKFWVSEKEFVESKKVDEIISELKEKGFVYEKEGALWFKSSEFGDDKDRVLKKSNQDLTYFATDICYHADKFKRGYDLLIDVWGADHHGYVPRLKSAIKAIGKDPEDLKIILIQIVNLIKSGKQIAMSTRAGQFVTLSQLCKDIGVDAARFVFLSRKSDSHLDVDLDLLKQKSMENPVYYVQYAHARICSVFSKAKEKSINYERNYKYLYLLDTADDIKILKKLDVFPEMVELAGTQLSPHVISFYLTDLAGLFHHYYNKHPILNLDNKDLIQARLLLLEGIAQVIRTGLDLLGVTAPEKM